MDIKTGIKSSNWHMIILCSSQRIGMHFLVRSFSAILILTPKINHSDPVTNSLSVSIFARITSSVMAACREAVQGLFMGTGCNMVAAGDPSMVASYLIQIMTLDQISISFQPCFLEQGAPTATCPCVLFAVVPLLMTWRTLDETK